MNLFFGIRSYRIIVATVFALILTLGWTVAAHAASPFDTQYGSPTAPVSTMTDGGASAGGSGGSAVVAVSGGSADTAVPAAATSSGTSAVTGLLPDTGGSLFVGLLLGTALVGTGLLLLRRINSH